MIKYRYLGKGYTDENGVAHMTEDANGQAVAGYTGTGRGLTDVVASTDDKDNIKESSLQSEIYEVYDCIHYDGGTSSDPSVSFWNTARGSLNRGTDGTELLINSGQTSTQAYFNLTNTDSFVIEFDAMFDGSSNLVQLRDSNWSVLDYVRGSNYNKDTWYTVKIEVKNGQSIITVGNTQQTPKTLTGIAMFVFALSNTDNYFKFKNFKYYPI